MNARVSEPVANDRAREASPADVARELRAAGEALLRAATVIASLGRRTRPEHRQATQEGRAVVSIGERLSGRQLGAIRAASRRAGLSRGALAELLEQLTGKQEPATLTRAEASGVLDKLSAMTGYQR